MFKGQLMFHYYANLCGVNVNHKLSTEMKHFTVIQVGCCGQYVFKYYVDTVLVTVLEMRQFKLLKCLTLGDGNAEKHVPN